MSAERTSVVNGGTDESVQDDLINFNFFLIFTSVHTKQLSFLRFVGKNVDFECKNQISESLTMIEVIDE